MLERVSVSLALSARKIFLPVALQLYKSQSPPAANNVKQSCACFGEGEDEELNFTF